MKKKAALLCAAAALILLGIFLGRLPAQPQRTSAELRAVQTTLGTTVRTDYLDADGKITFASDMGYATMTRQRNEAGMNILERYYDETGEPIALKAGYCGIARTYNDKNQCLRITFLDEAGNPVNSTAGYAVTVQTFHENGLLDTQTYFDAAGKPARDWTGTYGSRRLYDEVYRNTETIFLSVDGQPARTEMGYASVRRTFDENGRVHTEYFRDVLGDPARGSAGEYGVHFDYDAAGRIAQRTYLGPDGEPFTLPRGFSSMRTEYDAGGVRLQNSYYDLQGNPARVLRRYHAVRFEGGKQTYLDEQSREVFLLDVFLHEHQPVVAAAGAALCLAALVLPNSFRLVMAGCYVLFIFYMTLMYRETGDSRARMQLFWSYRQFFTSQSLRKDVINNIILFIPFGALLGSMTKKCRILLLPLVLTCGIELIQYLTGVGLCETDDIFSNTLGACIGFFAVLQARKRLENHSRNRKI